MNEFQMIVPMAIPHPHPQKILRFTDIIHNMSWKKIILTDACSLLPALAVILFFVAPAFEARAKTEVLYWNTAHQKNVTCIYGQITVLATVPRIYYCGAEWYGVGGYSGIQDLPSKGKPDLRNIFSIWDTSKNLPAKITQADPDALISRFGGEGTGAHANMLNVWKIGRTYQFFIQKTPGKGIGTTDTSYYYFDSSEDKWRHLATINSPNGPKNAGVNFGGVVSWIENIGGQAPAAIPKMALYRLWIGPDVEDMKCLTHSSGQSGSGRWGQLDGQYFLAEGSPANLDALFAKLRPKYGDPVFGMDGKELPPLADLPLSDQLIAKLEHLPSAPAAEAYH
ncbi:MAG TPA: DUF3472 domain-containing protein [Phycisphaerae bacterium]|nr:DUF3472 domain-containing protein [Phycisphaerae bacterium]